MPGSGEALDRTELLESFGGDEETLKEIIYVFRRDSPRLLHDIRDAIARADGEALRRQAHSLRGCVGYFSAEAASKSALELELMGQSGQLAGAEGTYEALETQMGRLERTLLAVLEGEGSTNGRA